MTCMFTRLHDACAYLEVFRSRAGRQEAGGRLQGPEGNGIGPNAGTGHTGVKPSLGPGGVCGPGVLHLHPSSQSGALRKDPRPTGVARGTHCKGACSSTRVLTVTARPCKVPVPYAAMPRPPYTLVAIVVVEENSPLLPPGAPFHGLRLKSLAAREAVALSRRLSLYLSSPVAFLRPW